MQIVIDLPENEYKWIIKSDETIFANVASKECMLNAIKNGTPLPKRHGRLIDADALPLNDIDNANYGSNYIRIAPTIIEASE